MKKFFALVLAIIMIISLVGCGKKTLVDYFVIKSSIDDYTNIEAFFYGDNPCDEGHNNCCCLIMRYYKDALYTPTGRVQDRFEETHIPCTVTENTLVLNGIDRYNYTINEEDKIVVFSKPFFEITEWQTEGLR